MSQALLKISVGVNPYTVEAGPIRPSLASIVAQNRRKAAWSKGFGFFEVVLFVG